MRIPEHFRLAPEILRRCNFYRKSCKWTRQQILDYQDAKLKEIVGYAHKYVPYYQRLFDEIGLDVKSFRGRVDMGKIPLLDKETLRTRTQEFIATTAHILDTRVEKTSGSTGTPLNLMIDRHSRANKYAAYLRAYFWAGYFPGATRFVLKGLSESKAKAYGFDLSRNMVYLNSSRMSRDNCRAAARMLKLHKPSVCEGYARSFLDFSRICQEEGLALPEPKGVFVYGETVTPETRSRVEEAYKSKLYDFYSHAENAAMICEMPDNRKYLMEDYFYPEIVIPEGKPAEDGYGELVGTSFYNYAMPLIRYKTRDLIRLGDDKNGSLAYRNIDSIEGRTDDCIILPDGRRIYFAEGAVGYARGVLAAQYIQDYSDNLTINLVVDDSFSEDQYPLIEQGLVKRIGNSLRLTFRIVSELEKKNSGKTPFIINKIST